MSPATTLSIITPDGTYQLGSGEPIAEVHAETYELFRAIFGRRSHSQIESWAVACRGAFLVGRRIPPSAAP